MDREERAGTPDGHRGGRGGGAVPAAHPGDQFHYNSYHLVDSDSEAEGAYMAKDEKGNALVVRIPAFELVIPIA